MKLFNGDIKEELSKQKMILVLCLLIFIFCISANVISIIFFTRKYFLLLLIGNIVLDILGFVSIIFLIINIYIYKKCLLTLTTNVSKFSFETKIFKELGKYTHSFGSLKFLEVIFEDGVLYLVPEFAKTLKENERVQIKSYKSFVVEMNKDE